GEGAVGDHGFREGGAGDVLGGHPRCFGVGGGIEHGWGERTANHLRDPSLASETGTEGRILREFLVDDLHRGKVSGRGPRKVDLAHAADTEYGQDPVGAYLGGVGRGQGLHIGSASVALFQGSVWSTSRVSGARICTSPSWVIVASASPSG